MNYNPYLLTLPELVHYGQNIDNQWVKRSIEVLDSLLQHSPDPATELVSLTEQLSEAKSDYDSLKEDYDQLLITVDSLKYDVQHPETALAIGEQAVVMLKSQITRLEERLAETVNEKNWFRSNYEAVNATYIELKEKHNTFTILAT